MSVYIKQYRVKSGGTVVQVIYKRGRTIERTVHIGTAHSEADLAALIALAEQTMLNGQLSLELDCESVADVIGMTLEKTYSKLLYETLGVVYDRQGFDVINDKVFKAVSVS